MSSLKKNSRTGRCNKNFLFVHDTVSTASSAKLQPIGSSNGGNSSSSSSSSSGSKVSPVKSSNKKKTNTGTGGSKKKATQLSPIKQKFQKKFGQAFQHMAEKIESLIGNEDIDGASEKLDDLVRFVEDTHYVDGELRKQHVSTLYELNESLEHTENAMKEKIGTHRREGNDLLMKIAVCLQSNEFTTAKSLTEKAIVAYKKAQDSRWKTLQVLVGKLIGDEAACHAEAAFEIGDVATAMRLGKAAQIRYREYKKSNLSQQCQLLLSIGSSQMEWSHDCLNDTIQLDQTRLQQFAHPRKHFLAKARAAIPTCMQLMREALENEAFDAFDAALDRITAYCRCLNEPPDAVVARLGKKRQMGELRMMIRLLQEDATPEYTWIKTAERVYGQMVDRDAVLLMRDEGAITAAVDRVLNFPSTLKYAILLEELTRRLMDLDFDRNTMVQDRFVEALLCSLETTSGIPVSHKCTALTTLLVFANSKPLVHVLLKAGTVRVLVAVRNEKPTEAEFVTLVAMGLKHLAINKQAMAVVSAEAGIVTMIGILRRSPRLNKMVGAVVAFFRNALKFLSSDGFDTVLDNGFIQAFVAGMIAQRADEKLQLQACQLIDELSFIERARIILIKANVLTVLNAFCEQLAARVSTSENQQQLLYLQTLVKSLQSPREPRDDNTTTVVEEEQICTAGTADRLAFEAPPPPPSSESESESSRSPPSSRRSTTRATSGAKHQRPPRPKPNISKDEELKSPPKPRSAAQDIAASGSDRTDKTESSSQPLVMKPPKPESEKDPHVDDSSNTDVVESCSLKPPKPVFRALSTESAPIQPVKDEVIKPPKPVPNCKKKTAGQDVSVQQKEAGITSTNEASDEIAQNSLQPPKPSPTPEESGKSAVSNSEKGSSKNDEIVPAVAATTPEVVGVTDETRDPSIETFNEAHCVSVDDKG